MITEPEKEICMSISQAPETKPKKLLIITSSGGGGLIQTANAKEQEALSRDPSLIIVRKDLLKDWVPFSTFFINFWNRAQQKGQISAQMICVKGQFIWDFFLYPSVLFYALYTFLKEDVDYVIDTQPLGTSAIVKALNYFNRKRNKKVRVEKVLVDLPTKQATHFFGPIKKLSKKTETSALAHDDRPCFRRRGNPRRILAGNLRPFRKRNQSGRSLCKASIQTIQREK